MRKSTTGEIYRFIKSFDNDTIIRKTNMRAFSEKENLDYTVCQGKWMIDMDMFLEAINPKKTKKSVPFPRMRTKTSAQREWNATHRRKIKHFIINCICNSGKVFVYKHGRTNIINYDQLEQELIKELKQSKKKDGKYLLAKHFCTIFDKFSIIDVLNKDGEKLINTIKEKLKKAPK